mgnify:CR=1 FL=1|jgi:Flp pilus assembly protein TadD
MNLEKEKLILLGLCSKTVVLALVILAIQSCTVPRRHRSPSSGKVSSRSAVQPSGSETGLKSKAPVPRPGDSSLLAKITPNTAPRQAVSLRLTEEGKKLILSGEFTKAVVRLEKSLAVDSTNPYTYFYLARAHFHLGHHEKSLNFLEVAESFFNRRPSWLGEVYMLKGDNFRVLGATRRARSNFSKALRLDPANRVAAEKLSRLQRSMAVPARR